MPGSEQEQAGGDAAERAAVEEIDSYLQELAPIGWRFGLERMHRLLTALGMPQRRFASIHVVGTNGKSSVTEIAAALLDAHGRRSGAYLSPHESRWSERIRIAGSEIPVPALAAGLEQVRSAAAGVERSLGEDERVTQFEAITAAAFVALASARVKVGVIEAGLGGRLDATNVLPSKVTVLTSVGLEHTQWLGETTAAIAGEKLAVLRDYSTLAVGRLDDEIATVAATAAAARHARLINSEPALERVPQAVAIPYLRHNFALALTAVEAVIGATDPEVVERVGAGLSLPGRMQVRQGPPPLILDAAHNPDGAAALAEALPHVAGDRPVIGCLSILIDKPAAEMIEILAPRLDGLVCTELPSENVRSLGRPLADTHSAAELARLAKTAGIGLVEQDRDPKSAIDRARGLAVRLGGVALISGSHYLLPYVDQD